MSNFFWALLIYFLTIFQIKIPYVPFQLSYIFVLFFLIIFLFDKKIKFLSKKIFFLFLPIFIFFVASFFTSCLNNFYEQNLFYSYLVAIFYFIPNAFVVSVLLQTSKIFNSIENRVLSLFFIASCLQGIGVLCDIFLPSFRELQLEVLDKSGLNDNYANLNFRSSGFSGTGGSTLGFLIGLGGGCGILLLQQKRAFIFILGILLCVLGVCFTGRTGFIPLLLATLFFFFGHKLKKNKTLKNYVLYTLGILLFGLILFFSNEDLKYFLFYKFTFVPIKEFFEGERDIFRLNNHIYLPENTNKLFGNAIWENERFSDIGYLRNLYYFGIIGCILYYSTFLLYAFVFIKKYWKEKIILNLFLIFVICAILIEAKEPFLQKNTYLSSLLFLVFYKKNKSLEI